MLSVIHTSLAVLSFSALGYALPAAGVSTCIQTGSFRLYANITGDYALAVVDNIPPGSFTTILYNISQADAADATVWALNKKGYLYITANPMYPASVRQIANADVTSYNRNQAFLGFGAKSKDYHYRPLLCTIQDSTEPVGSCDLACHPEAPTAMVPGVNSLTDDDTSANLADITWVLGKTGPYPGAPVFQPKVDFSIVSGGS